MSRRLRAASPLRASGIVLGILALLLSGAGVPSICLAQTVTLSAPPEATVGESIEVTWDGPVEKTDFISVDEEGAPDRSYGAYFYPSKGSPGVLAVPDLPGKYVIRYHSGASGYKVLGSVPIEVKDTVATFPALDPVAAGDKATIPWEGPGRPRDFISIDTEGSADRAYGPYAYATRNPVTIVAPDEAGTYVVRYHLARSYRVIGEATLIVGGVSASIDAPAEASAGSDLEISWEGPNNATDFLSIDPVGAADREYGGYVYTAKGSPAKLRVPEVPGSYLVRYHMGRSMTVLASSELEVLANSATVSGPNSVVAGSKFEVQWTGPDNRGDYLTIVPEGADPREYLSYAYTRRGTPAQLQAPIDAGPHELRYMTGATRQVLASTRIEVTPGEFPGQLRVFREGGTAEPSAGAVEVILDASGSMLKRLDGERRIEIAKRALAGLVERVIPEGTRFALRVFGHREADACRSDLEIAAAPLSRTTAAAKIREIEAMNLAKTPIAASLLAVKTDLAGASGPVTVVLVTDGEETCDGDPAAAIAQLRAAGFDVRVNIVGFAIDEQLLKEQFESWARAGGGRYVEANDGAELEAAMGVSLEEPFEIVQSGEIVASGVVGGDSVRLLPGTYQVRLLGPKGGEVGEVEIQPDGRHDFRVP